MADISLPPGAFAAAKSGAPQPTPQPKAEPKVEPKPTPAKTEPVIDPEAKTEPPKGLTAAERKIWKLKADGEEFEFDATDEEAIKREIMKARGADKRFESGAALKKQAETFFEMIKNPETLRRVLTDPRVGVDVKKFAEEIVWEQIQAQQREEEWKKSPEKKAQWEREQKLKEYEEREARETAEGNTRAEREAQQRFEASYETKITKALEVGGIPKTPAAVARMAEYLMKSVEHGIDLSPEDLVEQVRKDYMDDFAAVLGQADGDQLLRILGESNAEKLRKADLKRLKSPQQNPFPKRSEAKQAANARDPAQPKKLAGSDWRDAMKKEFLNRNR